MTARPRSIVAGSSVALFAIVNFAAANRGVEDGRSWLLLCAVLATAAALQSIAWEPADLLAALTLSLVPMVGLVAADGSVMLVGSLAILLLIAAELNVLAWEMDGIGPRGPVLGRRLVSLGRLALLAFAAITATALVTAAPPALAGIVAVIVASAAVILLGPLVFRRLP
jgi:hypothetical protein